ncbi:hypothetical protein ACFU0X_10230 [Streptomyces cellulosae]|uniref:Ig-like domain-containing protein n=1 Tax=Streptomyces cellulosae TaxID=1968 RepID=A0ABW6JDH0_STRCE
MSLSFPASPAEADPVLGPLLNQLQTCVCFTLAEAGRGVCTQCSIVPGDSRPPADRCDCACGQGQGQAWVRWVRDEPVMVARNTGPGSRRGCQQWRTFKVIEVGVYRCVSGPDDQGNPPSPEARERDALGLIWDRRLLVKGISCCAALKNRRVELLSLEPTAVKGNCAGVVVQLSVDA